MAYACRILADSISPAGHRITSFEVTFPRIVLAEMNTHCALSRNSASSRAIPVAKRIAAVEADPFVPEAFGRNQKGMQPGEALDGDEARKARLAWTHAGVAMTGFAGELAELGVHKQYANRLLEPFSWHTAVITATDLDNFFHLRVNPLAQGELRKAAELMQANRDNSEPRTLNYGDWHLPYVEPGEAWDLEIGYLDPVKISVARCARVSYLTQNGVRDSAEDVALADRLVENGHMCFDAETEVLTRDGWKRWPDVTERDFLFAVDPVTKEGCFELPRKLHSFRSEEPMYRIWGQQLDLEVTFNHRMLVAARRNDGTWSPYAFARADEIQGKPRRYLKSANFNGHGDVPSYDRSTAFMRLLGFFVGDGYAVGGNQARFHLKKKRKIEYLKSLGFPIRSLAHDTFVVELPRIGEWLRVNCYESDGQKMLPQWVMDLNEAQTLALFDGLKNSDGSMRRKTWIYSTTSQQVADTLQALLHIHGKVGSFSYTCYGHANKRAIRVNVSDRIAPRVEPNQEGRALSYTEEIVPYAGIVYCATTSTGALMVRRNGHVAVSGNSPLEHVARPMHDIELRITRTFDITLDDGPILRAGGVDVAAPEVGQKIQVGGSNLLTITYVRGPLHYSGKLNGWISRRSYVRGEHDILGTREEGKIDFGKIR